MRTTLVLALCCLGLSCGPTQLPGKCTAQSCTGCCSGDTCVAFDGQDDTFCGAAGAECLACGVNTRCTQGACLVTQACATANGGCDANATCRDAAGGTACACKAGYVGDGRTCLPQLASLSVTPGFLGPVFRADLLSYAVVAPAGATAVTVTAAAADPASTQVFIDGVAGPTRQVTLAGAGTAITVEVRATATTRNQRYRIDASVSTTTLSQRTAFKPTTAGAGLRFGAAVALSADGSTLAVGAPLEGAGAAQRSGAVFVFRNTAGTWAPEATVVPPNRDAYDLFGAAVALSADGSTLLVGATGDDSASQGVGGNPADNTSSDSGAAWVFRRTGAAWAQEAFLKASNADPQDGFGWAVALAGDGNTALVGAPFEDSAATGVGGNGGSNATPSSGAAYTFTRGGTAWAAGTYLKAPNTGLNDNFGRAVALSGDGLVLAVGAVGEDSAAQGVGGNQADSTADSAGAAYVFRRGTGVAFEAYVKASNTAAQARFGAAVALSQDGSVLAVGAPGESSGGLGVNPTLLPGAASGSGAAYVFRRAGAWSQEAVVKTTNAEAGDAAGAALALSADGATLAVGAPWEDSDATGVDGNQGSDAARDSGAVFVFRRGAAWQRLAYAKASNAGAADTFGAACALSSNGAALVASAPGEDSDATGVTSALSNEAALDRGAAYGFRE